MATRILVSVLMCTLVGLWAAPLGANDRVFGGTDTDLDGILDDGDLSGDPTDNYCTGGVTTNCDDNCVNDANAGQEDLDGDGIGDVCDGGVPGTLVDFVTTLSTPSTFVNLTVAGGALIADASVTVTGDLIVGSGGNVTHSQRLLQGLVLNVGGTLDVQSGGAMDLIGRGLYGGNNGSAFDNDGEAIDPADGTTIISAANGTMGQLGGGGSYGGRGGDGETGVGAPDGLANQPYGLIENPVNLGSGGGATDATSGGGNGGGRLTVVAGTLNVDGNIYANGLGGETNVFGQRPGGGSGGSILIDADVVSGAGTIQARGGFGGRTSFWDGSGHGGGGRIAIYANTVTLPTTSIQAFGQWFSDSTAPTSRSSAGTVWLRACRPSLDGGAGGCDQPGAPPGDLIIDNGNRQSPHFTQLMTNETTFGELTVRRWGKLELTNPPWTTVTLDQSPVIQSTGELIVRNGVTLDVPSGSFDVDSSARVLLESGATLQSGTLDLNVSAGATFDYAAGSSIAATLDVVTLPGGTLNVDAGVPFAPAQIMVSGGELNVDQDLSYPGVGDFIVSSAGTVNILPSRFLRLPVFDATNVQDGTVSVAETAELRITSNVATITDGVTLVKDGVFGACTGGCATGTDTIGSLTVASGGTIVHSPRLLAGLDLTVDGTLDLQSGGTIDLNGRGLYGGDNGSAFDDDGETFDSADGLTIISAGNGTMGNLGGGGSYGGRGGDGETGAGVLLGLANAPYGLLENPVHLGSGGGGTSSTSGGGNGGGRLTITAGTLNVDGYINANGTSGSTAVFGHRPGGGSGGAVRIDADVVSGAGFINARGGYGGRTSFADGGGSGSGGRIAVYANSMTLLTTHLHALGYSDSASSAIAPDAGAGTVWVRACRPSLDGGAGGCDQPGAPPGDLFIDNVNRESSYFTPLLTNETMFGTLTVRRWGKLELTNPPWATFTVDQIPVIETTGELIVRDGVTLVMPSGSLAVDTSARVLLESGATLQSGTLDLDVLGGATFDYAAGSSIAATLDVVTLSGGGTLNVDAGVPFAPAQIVVSGGVLNADQDLSYPGVGDFILSAAGTVNIFPGRFLRLPVFDATNIQSGTVSVPATAELRITSDTATIANGVTLVKDGVFGACAGGCAGGVDTIGSLTVESGGYVVHSPALPSGLTLNVDGALDVQSGGFLYATGRGLAGGNAGSAFGNNGEAIDPADGTTVISAGNGASSTLGGGGSHGGPGGLGQQSGGAIDGVTNAPYGLLEDPAQLGTGGGGSDSVGGTGGRGGGRVTVRAGTVNVDGQISANGVNGVRSGNNVGGAGSGGSIFIDAGAVSGSGLIWATGGIGIQTQSGGHTAGSGSGGRIAVYTDNLTFPTTSIYAYGNRLNGFANTRSRAAAGSIWVRGCRPSLDGGAGGCDQPLAPAGDVIVDNFTREADTFTPFMTNETDFGTLIVRRRGQLSIDPLDHPHVFALGLSITNAGSALSYPARRVEGLRVSLKDTFTLDAAATGILANGAGLLGGGDSANPYGDAGEAFDTDGTTVIAGSSAGSGASHGGAGGGPSPNATYGSALNPRSAGSGGSRTAASGRGGAGGGRFWIDASTCALDAGTLTVGGGAAVGGSGAQGGGAGGSLKLDCVTVSGSPDLLATGGAGAGTNGNGGGGGRVALRTNNNNLIGDFFTLCDASGGAATGTGGAGLPGTCMLGDLVAPTVTAMSIAPGATFVGLTDTLTITFSENLYDGPGAIVPAHMLLSGATSGAQVPTQLSFDNMTQTLTATYPADLPDDDYMLILVSGEETEGLSDSSVNALDGEYSGGLPSGDGASGGDFMVTFDVDAPPWVTSVSPQDGALGVPLATNVRLRFTEPLDPGSVSSTSVILTDVAAGTPVPASYSLPPGGAGVTIDPDSPLLLGRLYRVEVTSALTDLTANPAVVFSSLFRTSSVPTGEVTLPSVSEALASLGASATAGAAIAQAGDIDEDGTNDMLVGAPGYEPSGIVEAGAVAIFLGSTDAGERASPDVIFEGVDAHDRTGTSVAGAFDFNDDGHLDIVIGATQVNRTPDDDPVAGCDAGDPCGAGKVYVIYFDPTDTTTYPNLGTPATPDVIDLSRVANGLSDEVPGLVLTGIALGDEAGFAVAGGPSLNPDAIDDIAIGAPGVDAVGPPALTDSGGAYVIFGSASLSGVHSLSETGPVPMSLGRVYRGEFDGGRFGSSVAFTGDIVVGMARTANSGGDLAIGAPYEDGEDSGGNPVTEGGVVYFDDGGDMDTDEVFPCLAGDTEAGAQILGTQPFEHLGTDVADGGDNRHNGTSDVLMGAPDYDVDLLADAGRVVQTSSPLAQGIYLADDIGTTEDGVIWTGADAGDGLGSAVEGVGDVTGDGVDDIVLAAPYADPEIMMVTYADAGAVYLIEGEAPAVGTEGTVSVSEVGSTVPGEVLVGTQTDEQAGSALAGVGDFDGNGDEDFAVGAPLHDNGGDLDSGIVYAVLDSEPPPPPASGDCDVGGCIVIDDVGGALLDVSPGALAGPLSIGLGSLDLGSLPGVPPAGTVLVAAVSLTPDAQALSQPADVYLPVLPEMQSHVVDFEAFDLYCWIGGMWVDTGNDAIAGDGPVISSDKAVAGQISTLATCAVFAADCDDDGTRDLTDNCPCTPNVSQIDTNGNGIGDACETSQRLLVSSDPMDMADFATIQAAVEAVSGPGAKIVVLPGTGAYLENVVIDEGVVLSITGSTSGGPVLVDGSGAPAIDVVSTSSLLPVSISNLTLGGTSGLRAAVPSRVRDVTIDNVSTTAVELTGGTHDLRRVSIDGALDGVVVALGATLELNESSIESVTGTSLRVDGNATVETVLLAAGGQGIVVGATGVATVTGSTVAAHSGAGVDGSSGGAVTLTRAIVHGNGGGDLVGVSCANVFASVIGGVDCSASNGNLFTDPLLDGGYRPTVGSLTIDVGVDPALYDGTPCRDLGGGPRLRDGNGDGLADGDLGAFEHVAPATSPGEVANVVWSDGTTMTWDVNVDAVEYHVYRGELANLGYADYGACRDDLDPLRTDESLTEMGDPPAGTVWFYLITAESGGGVEGTTGLGSCAERSRFAACP